MGAADVVGEDLEAGHGVGLGFVAQAVVMEESHPWLEAALV